MYKLNANARDHLNCSPLLFSWPAPRNRCGQTERGQWYQHCRSLYWILLWMRPKIWLALLYASSHCFLTFKSLEKKTIPRSFKDWASSSCCPHNRYCLCHSGPLPVYICLLAWSARPTQPICHRHQQLVVLQLLSYVSFTSLLQVLHSGVHWWQTVECCVHCSNCHTGKWPCPVVTLPLIPVQFQYSYCVSFDSW